MKQKTLSNWLKAIIVGALVAGTVIYAWIIPLLGRELVSMYPEFAKCYIPWLTFLIISGIPCYAALVFSWKIAANIGKDQSFSLANAKLLKGISVLAGADSAFVFVGNFALLLLNMNHPSIILASLFVVLLGIAISALAAVLSHLVRKAADLQEQSDLTI